MKTDTGAAVHGGAEAAATLSEHQKLNILFEKHVTICLQACSSNSVSPPAGGDDAYMESKDDGAMPLASSIAAASKRPDKQLIALKTDSVELLSLLMVLDASAYDRYLDTLLKAIDEERAEPRKSPQVTQMLKAVFDGLIVHSYMLKAIPAPDWKTT